MLKKFAFLSFCLIITAMPAAMAQEGNLKIAIIDIDRVLATSEMGKQLQAKLKTFADGVQKEGEGMANKAMDTQKKLQENAASLSETQIAAMRKELQDAQINIRRFEDDKKREVQRMQQEGLGKIQSKMRPVLGKVQEQFKYDLILSANDSAIIAWGPSIDITEKVIEMLNAEP